PSPHDATGRRYCCTMTPGSPGRCSTWLPGCDRDTRETPMPIQIHRVGPDEIALMEAVATTFGEGFDDPETYTGRRPSAAYLRCLLAGETFMAFAALDGSAVVG